MWEPKLGDVVALRSHPDHRMTVVGYNREKKFYSCVWATETGAANGIDIIAEGLCKVEEGPDSQALRDRIQEVQIESTQISRMLADVSRERGAIAAELALHKAANVRAVLAARKVLDEVRADAPADELVGAVADRYQALQRDANQQIERIRTKLKEAGLD